MFVRVRWIVLMVLAALAVEAEAQQVKFSVTCDNRNYAGFSDVLNEISLRAGGPGQLMVSPGDFDPCADSRTALDTAFGGGFVWYPVVGNHELPGGGSESYSGENMDYLRGYNYGTVNPGPAGCAETTFSFDVGPVHIACINEYWNGQPGPGSDVARDGDVVPELRQWLDDDLAASSKKWKLVVGHEPAYPQPDEDWGDARHVGDSLDAYPANRDAFWSVLESHNVAAYITGHTHRFSHYQPPGSSVWQIDTGQARGIDQYDTFMIVAADETEIQFDVYRSLSTTQFSLTDSWSIPEPATLGLFAAGGLLLLRRKPKSRR